MSNDYIEFFLRLQDNAGSVVFVDNSRLGIQNGIFGTQPGHRNKLLGASAFLSSLLALTPNSGVMARGGQDNYAPSAPASAVYYGDAPFGTTGTKAPVVRKTKKTKTPRVPLTPEQKLEKLEKENEALWGINKRLSRDLHILQMELNMSNTEIRFGVQPMFGRQPFHTVEEGVEVLGEENYRLQKNNNVLREEIDRLRSRHERQGYDRRFGRLDSPNVAPRVHRPPAGRYSVDARNR